MTDIKEPATEEEVHREALNALASSIGDWAESKGFWDEWRNAATVEALAEKFHGYQMFEVDPSYPDARQPLAPALKNIAASMRSQVIGTKLMLMVSELGEALETLRDTGVNGHLNGEGNLGEELADCIIRILDTCYHLDIDIGAAVTEKVKVNNDRAHKHGRKF